MANKNTRRARKMGLSAWPEITIGTGEHRKVETIERQKVMTGNILPRTKARPKVYPRITAEQRAKNGN